MHGIGVKKTYREDFEKIYPLLKMFNAPYTKDEWQRIFNYQWYGQQNFVGFHLEYQAEVVGFMGLIFSIRDKDERQYQFCNITSLIVKENYRAATLLLIRKLKTLDKTILTGFRPIMESYRLLTLIGFQAYEHHYRIIPTLSYAIGKRNRVNIVEFPQLLERLSSENKRVVMDHVGLQCHSILFEFKQTSCLLIYKLTKQKHFGIGMTKIHLLYLSDVCSFNKNKATILHFLNRKIGRLSALYLDCRFLNHTFLSLRRPISPPRICLNPFGNQVEIDELYSESVLL